jgi:hypothetical protein
MQQFDHPLGLLLASAATPRRAYVGEGLVTYLTSNPFAYHGALVAPVAVAGLVAIVRPPTARRRAARFLAIVAIGQLVSVGLASHGQPRYVFPAIALLVVLGVEGATRIGEPARRLLARFAAGAVVATWVVTAIAAVPFARHMQRAYRPVVAAAAAVRRDAAGRPCVVTGVKVPPLMWYAGCDGHTALGRVPAPAVPGRVGYLVGTPAAPVDLAAMSGGRPTTPVLAGEVTVVRVDAP